MRTVSKWSICVLLATLTCTVSSYAQKDPVIVTPSNYTYVDLYTGETITVYYDTLSWATVNKVTLQPVEYYVIKYNDRPTYDTVHGITGIVTNGLLIKSDDGKWTFNDAKVKWDGKELKMKDAYGRKVKWEAGEMKIKDWNSKYKSEKGDDAKYKQEWDKVKWKEDGTTKTETGTKKVKTDN
jgi:hypothetical protein